MSWYNDKISNSTAQLAIAGAGGGAKALGELAKIPLAADGREARDRKFQIEEDDALNRLIIAQLKAGASMKVATTNAKAAVATAKIRHTDHETDYNKARYVSDGQGLVQASKSADNAASNATKVQVQNLKNSGGKAVARLNLQGKKVGVKPKVTIKYGADGKRLERTVVKPYAVKDSKANFLIELEEKAKKYKARK